MTRADVDGRRSSQGAAALGAAGALPAAGRGPAPRRPRSASWSSPRAATSRSSTRTSARRRTTSAISFNIFDNLIARYPDGKLHPALATEWKLHGPDHLGVQAPPGREVAQRRSVHRRPTPSSASSGPTIPNARRRVNTVFTTDRPHRGAGRRRPRSSTPRSPTRCCRRAWPSTAARSCPRSTSRRSAPTRSTPSPWAPGPCASSRGRRTTGSCSRPTPTTGAASPTSTA